MDSMTPDEIFEALATSPLFQDEPEVWRKIILQCCRHKSVWFTCNAEVSPTRPRLMWPRTADGLPAETPDATCFEELVAVAKRCHATHWEGSTSPTEHRLYLWNFFSIGFARDTIPRIRRVEARNDLRGRLHDKNGVKYQKHSDEDPEGLPNTGSPPSRKPQVVVLRRRRR